MPKSVFQKSPPLKALTAALFTVSLSGCAGMFLDGARSSGPLKDRELSNFNEMLNLGRCTSKQPSCIQTTIKYAFDQSNAYAKAARATQTTQDLISFGILRAAGLVAKGALDGVDDVILAERAIEAAALQQTSARYTPKTAVQALYVGASRMNCISLTGSLYEEIDLKNLKSGGRNDNDIPVALASMVMVLAMREVEYRTLYGVSRNTEDFSNLVEAFGNAISSAADLEVPKSEDAGGGGESTVRTQTADKNTGTEREFALRQNPGLERFFRVISGCLETGSVKPSVPSK